MNILLITPSLLSVVVGIIILLSSFRDHVHEKDWFGKSVSEQGLKKLHAVTLTTLAVSALIALFTAWSHMGSELHLFSFVGGIPVYFKNDEVSALFVSIVSVVWPSICIYAFKYMKHEGNEKRFFGIFLIVFAVVIALSFSGNLITFYFCYELMTITSMVLVLHNGTKEAIMAALKYLFYSMAGAYCALYGIYILYQNTNDLTFTPGGTLNLESANDNRTIVLIAIFFMLIGFGAKAGMLPLHGWLPTAHPVAPAPASAALSAIIVKGGVLAIIRTVYYIVGADFIRGTWVQYAWMGLALMTVLMGSMLAYKEKVFKKRLAYSTVSQVSYIIFGLSCLNSVALQGALLHVVFHAIIKTSLFLTAGIFIFRTGKIYVDDFVAIGKKYPLTLWGFTFCSLALIGIPPCSGFISKWYLAQGALGSDIGLLRFIGPCVLLFSALLTAGYLLPIVIRGFLPGKECTLVREKEKIDSMTAVVLIMAFFAVILGIFPNPLINFVGGISAAVL